MERGLGYIGIVLYILVNILNKHQFQSVRCYNCEFCPIVTNVSIYNANCTSCAMSNDGFSVHRTCALGSIPVNFPTVNLSQCYTDLCNGVTIDNTGSRPTGYIQKPISCYTCLNCTKYNYKIVSGCGGCVVSSNN
ncbi:unnamed protein product [Schistosoma turkestanicum]|nr:unnamed protein product [Schistosoma turkestanicum]